MTARIAATLTRSLLALAVAANALHGQGVPARDGYLLTSDSARIHSRIVGNAPDTIIALHGGPGGDLYGIMDDFAPLTLRHTVIFYDQRGGGRSELPADTTRLLVGRQVADLDDLRLHFGLARVSLVAHSFGPLLAASYALAHPTAVHRMVFFGPVSPRRDSMWVRMGRTLRSRLDSAQVERAAVLSRQRADSTADVVAACREYWDIYLLPRLAEPARTRTLLKLDLCASSVAAMLYSTRITGRVVLGSFGNWDLREQLRRLDVPTLVIHGEEDAIPMDMVEEWAAFLPHGELMRVSRAAHFPYVERAEIVWPAVERFLGQKDH
jgi:proline iminopeptidase